MRSSTTVSWLTMHVCSASSACKTGSERMLAEGHMIGLDRNLGAIYSGVLLVVALRPERKLAIVAGWHAAKVD
jgi:hypothetical protein